MAPSTAAPRGRRNQPPPPHPESAERFAGPAAAPWLPPLAAFARKLDPAAAGTDAPVVERPTRPAVAAPWLPPPAAFERKTDPSASTDAPAAERPTGPTVAAPSPPWLPPPAAFARRLHPAPPNPTPPAEADECQGAARGWADLPRDALAAVLRKLDHVEILMWAGQVCRSWRRAAREDPALWHRIDMRGHADLHRRVDLCGMAKEAIRRAKGKCEAFWAEYAADDDVLQLLGEQAPSLKSLCLISCQDIIRFEEEIKKFPLLEELEISLFTNICGKHVFQAVGNACRELKHFRFNSYRFINTGNREYSDDHDDDDCYDYDDNNLRYNKDDDAMGIASMHGLRTLQLFGNSLTNEGLTDILDNCPYLESLDVRHCFNIIMDEFLQANCARIKTLKLPSDSTDDYGFPVCSPLWSSGIESDSDALGSFDTYSGSDNCVYGDSDEYAVYYDPFRYLTAYGCEDELGPEQRMFLKDMRMLTRRKLDPATAMDAPVVDCARGPTMAAPWLPPPASFSRKLDPAAFMDVPDIEQARGPGTAVAAPWLPPPATFARRLGPTAPNPCPSEPLLPLRSLSSSSSRCSRSRNADECQGARGWVALPQDALAAVLRKLDHVEILMGFGQVCRSWCHAARDNPLLWRRIDMRGHANLHRRVDLCMMAKDAIRLAKGRCEAFWAEYAADDGMLQLLGEQAPSLKSLRLISCQDIIGFEEEIKKFPLLEELEISLFTNIGGKHVFQAVGQACPELKHFRFNSYRFINIGNREYSNGSDDDDYYDYDNYLRYNKDDDAMGIASMHGLRTLQLFGNSLTSEGLTAILDNCPHLESLDIRHCFNIIMDNTLLAKCARIKTLKLPSDSTDDYGFPVCSPLWSSGIESDSDALGSFGTYSGSDNCDYGDSDEHAVYYDPFRCLTGYGCEDELGPEQRMFLKDMRMLTRRKLDPATAMDAPVVDCARGPTMAAPWLPPPASFSRKLDPAAFMNVPDIEQARGPDTAVAAPWLPPPATIARRLGPTAPNPCPSEPLLPPRSLSSSSSRCSRSRNADECQGARGWVALPQDALAAVLRKLDHVEILMGFGQVCRSWRHTARDNPLLWRRIDMRGHANLHRRVDLCMMAKDAIRLAKGRCEAFWAEYAADDGVLHLLGEQAPSLKSLRLISCQDIIGFEEEIKKFPLLEELEISLFTNIGGKHVFQAVGQACPELKHFRFNSYRFINIGNREYSNGSDDDDYYDYDNYLRYNKDDDAMGIASMHGLRTLQLFGNSLTSEGLTAILDNCPHLESLDIRHCFNIIMDNTLLAKCARIKTLKLPSDSTDDYGFPVCSPLWSSGIESDSDALGSFGTYSGSDNCDYGDSDEHAVYYDPFRCLTGYGCEDELGPEQRMFLKDMRMLTRRKLDPATAMDAPVVDCARGPTMAAPWLPPPASFSRKLDPAAFMNVPDIEQARGPDTAVAAPWLPPPATIARRLGPTAPNPCPSEPLLPPRSLSSSSSRCSRSRNADECQGARGWVALPQDALAAVLRKLDHVEILMGFGQVCRSWRHTARDNPLLWRRIDMRGHANLHRRVDLCMMAKDAIRLAKGRCEAFWAEYAADDGVLHLLGEQAPSLKSLRLISCQDIIGFEEEIKKFPLLEELEISLFTNIGGKHVFQAVGQACPELKHFRFNSYRFINIGNREHSNGSDDDDYYDYDNYLRYNKDDDAMGIASMHGLRTLQLFGNSLTSEGLTAILDNCPHLESLDIRHCFNIIMDNTLLAKCARIKTLKLPSDSTDDYGFPVCSPLWSSGNDSDSDAFGTYSDSDDCVYGDYIMDSDEYDDYCDPFRYLNGVYEDELGPEDRMFIKGMRMLMRDDDDDEY